MRTLRAQGTHFRRQAAIGPYYADFACHRLKMIVELDGSGHAAPGKMVKDEARTRFLESHGYRVLRFWNSDVLADTDAVMLAIYQALNARVANAAPHP